MMSVFLRALALLAVAAAAPGHAADATLVIDEPWSRAMPPVAKTGAAYLTIRNTGSEDDRLVGARSPIAERAELHGMQMQGDLMKMHHVESVVVPAGGTAMLEPGGLHIMLMGLTRPLAAGESFPVTLQFEKAGELVLEVEIRDGTAGTMDHGGHGQHGMKPGN